MKTPILFLRLTVLALVLFTISSPVSTAVAQGTAFTYQGRLSSGATSADGIYDFQFALHDLASGGLPLEEVPVLTNAVIAVSDGFFTTTLDFGSEFSGFDRWLEISVRTNGNGSFTTLAPRQKFMPTPYAMYAPNAGYAGTSEAGGLLGTLPSSSIAPETITSAMLAPGAISGLGSPDGSPVNVLNVNTNGYVGLGTTNPTAALSLTGGPTQIVPRVLAEVNQDSGSFTNLGDPQSVAVKGNILAVGSDRSPGPHSFVTLVNIANPANPIWINTISDTVGVVFSNLFGVSDVAFSGTGSLLAIAARYSSTVTLVDVINPSNPVNRAELRDGVGSFLELEGARSVAFSGNLLAIAANTDSAVSLVDVSSPASPVFRFAMKDGQSGFNDLAGAYHLALSSNLLAIAASTDNAVTLVDVSNPTSPIFRAVLKDGVGGYNDLANPHAVAISGNLLAICAYADDAVTLVDISNPASPIQHAVLKHGIGGFQYLDGLSSVAFSSNLLAICSEFEDAVTLVDVSNPASPQLRGVTRNGVGEAHLQYPTDVVFVGTNFVVAASHSHSFTILTSELQIMGLSSAGWVGIGVAAPQAALHVQGDVLTEGDNFTVKATRIQFGHDVTASGVNSTAMGSLTTASGNSSTAMGQSTTASGYNSIAMGFATTASGEDSTAMGRQTTASGWVSTALGDRTTASGDYATAMGRQSIASGIAATAMGTNTFARGPASTAMGSLTTASNLASTAMGANTLASGDYSTAMGYGTTASGYNSTAMGVGTTASGTYATALGLSTTASGFSSTALGYDSSATHTSSFVWSDSSSTPGMSSVANHTFNVRATGGVHFQGGPDASLAGGGQLILGATTGANMVLDNNEIIARNNGAVAALHLNASGGDVYVGGTIIGTSDRNAKENFTPMDARSVLAKVLQLPISEWNYKTGSAMRHVGPMAQDFYAAFGLGPDDKHIATVDADGVALAAIQGLNEKMEARGQRSEDRIQKLESENAELKRELAQIKAMVSKLSVGKP